MILIKAEVKEKLKKRWWWYILEVGLFSIILITDLVSKYVLSNKIKLGSEKTFIPKVLSLTYLKNTGGAFSALENHTVFLTVITALLLIGIGVFLIIDLKQGLEVRIPLIFIVAGGFGNLVDRMKFGWVRDFFKFEFINWGVFNIADVFVSNGAIILIIVLIIQLVKEIKKDKGNKESLELASNSEADKLLEPFEENNEIPKEEKNIESETVEKLNSSESENKSDKSNDSLDNRNNA